MQDPNADTEWNDILRAKGILPPKEEKEITEEDIVQLVEETVEEKSKAKGMDEMTLEELDEEEDEVDEEEERLYQEYRRRRMAELKAAQLAKKFGSVTEITKADYVTEVNNAGEGIWVILHVYKQGIPLCTLVNQYLERLAQKFPESKFLKSISDLCIPNYPDKNLPSIFVYFENDLKKQFIGPLCFGGMNLKQDELEYMLAKVGAIKSDIEEPPKKEVEDVLTRAIRQSAYNQDDDGDD